MRFLRSISRALDRFIGSVLLTGVIAVIAGLGVLVIALYGTGHYKETESVLALRCLVQPDHLECPDQKAKVADLRAKLDGLAEKYDSLLSQRNAVQNRLASLEAIETAVDEVTLFETFTEPETGIGIVVGTVYKSIMVGQPKPERHFCYIQLDHGVAGESRNLSFHSRRGPIEISEDTLAKANVKPVVLAYGRLVCEPFMIEDVEG